MTPEDPNTTVGQTRFFQGENNTQPLFCIEPGIPCRHAREQSSELMDCVRHRVMENDQRMVWAAHYLGALAKALMDDAELGMVH
ncbi:DUF3077 domain-containing protein [Pseudomonas sp. MWU13-3659]|uniref:DUF3077 domain-containing protein n=1 Tax=Pseudomonas sp. MWU13-3659 TaxID=2986964 RepID=UPI002075C65A|nr:DUF3077 domain-containing protein [Pseudomonas sp. MWU13-3659]